MKCLVTGATGFIGESLCRALRARGDEVVQTSLQGASLGDGSSTLAIDFSTGTLDASLLRGVDTVFHLAGIAHSRATREQYHQVNYQAPVELAALASEAGVRRFVFLSSVKAMGPASSADERAESDVAEPESDYGRSKWRAECALRDSADNRDMATIILRPALVYGADAKGNLDLLARAVHWGLPRPPKGGARSMIAREDLVSLLLMLSGSELEGTATWIATDGQQYTTRRIYDALCRAEGKSPRRGWLPAWCWRMGARLLDLLREGSAERSYLKLFGDERYSNAELVAATGWQPRFTLEKALGVSPAHRVVDP